MKAWVGADWSPEKFEKDKIEFCNRVGWLGATADTVLTTDDWYHVAVVYTNQTFSFYLNGQSDGTNKTAGTFVNDTTSKVLIGAQVEYFNGAMDNVKIYDYARTGGQILADYNTGMIPEPSALLLLGVGLLASLTFRRRGKRS